MTRAGFLALVGLVLSACQGLPVATSVVSASETAGDVPARVLFVGNSFTYYNDSLHNHLRRLMNSATGDVDLPADPRMRIMTISGGRLAEHAGLEFMANAEPWNVIVLQGHSLEAHDAEKLADFHQAVDRHAATIRGAGARPALFMTWAYLGRPRMIETIARNYLEAGRRNDAWVIPVGLAFDRASRELSSVRLIHDDRRHPTEAGTYLAASVFLFSFYPTLEPASVSYAASLESPVALKLREVAWATARGQAR